MITGAHVIIYSTTPDADRAFLRDVLELPHLDAGACWLIFGLPPSEVAVHPGDKNDVHALYLMCEDVKRFIDDMHDRNVACGPVQEQAWGLLTQLTLPGGGKVGVYQSRHERPNTMTVQAGRKRSGAMKRRTRTLATRPKQR